MTIRKIIPDAYTTYEDGHLGLIASSLANVETKIGAASGGQPNKVYTLSGPDAKKQARIIFKGGSLLHAIEEALDAGSTRIHAVRLGNAQRAYMNLESIDGNNGLNIKGGYGTSGNMHYVNVTQRFDHIDTGYVAIFSGSPCKVVFCDKDYEIIQEIELDPQITSVAGVDVDFFPSGNPGFSVLGVGPAPDNNPSLWHYLDGELQESDTINLSSLIPEGDTISGLVGACGQQEEDDLIITTDKHLLFLDMSSESPSLSNSWDYASLGVDSPDIVSGTIWRDLAATLRGEDPEETVLLLDRNSKKIYAFNMDDDSPVLEGYLDISTWVGGDSPEGIASDPANGNILVAVRNSGSYPNSRVLQLAIDWDATPNPVANYSTSYDIGLNVYGLGQHIIDGEITTTITFQDRNESPVLSRSYEGSGNFLTVTAAVAQAINSAGIYEAELLSDPAYWLNPTFGENGPPDPTRFDPMSGGADSSVLTNGDYLVGLEATKSKTDTAWIHAVGANTSALWTAILLHCNEMFEQHHAERFAILETPPFFSTYDEGSAGYLSDLQDYVDNIVEMMEAVGDRNACVFAGGASFMNSDGNEYKRSVTSACGGTMAGLEVQKSLINKPVCGVLGLTPEFTPGHIQSLIQARVNCLRFKPGRGFIIAHSLTAAAVGSDYSRVNDLRAVYYGSKAAREAAQPYVGEENDVGGEGLRRLESAMARPLEQMRDGGQIDAFDLSAMSTQQDRLLGDVYVSLGIQPRRAMEMIYTTVYLK